MAIDPSFFGLTGLGQQLQQFGAQKRQKEQLEKENALREQTAIMQVASQLIGTGVDPLAAIEFGQQQVRGGGAPAPSGTPVSAPQQAGPPIDLGQGAVLGGGMAPQTTSTLPLTPQAQFDREQAVRLARFFEKPGNFEAAQNREAFGDVRGADAARTSSELQEQSGRETVRGQRLSNEAAELKLEDAIALKAALPEIYAEMGRPDLVGLGPEGLTFIQEDRLSESAKVQRRLAEAQIARLSREAEDAGLDKIESAERADLIMNFPEQTAAIRAFYDKQATPEESLAVQQLREQRAGERRRALNDSEAPEFIIQANRLQTLIENDESREEELRPLIDLALSSYAAANGFEVTRTYKEPRWWRHRSFEGFQTTIRPANTGQGTPQPATDPTAEAIAVQITTAAEAAGLDPLTVLDAQTVYTEAEKAAVRKILGGS